MRPRRLSVSSTAACAVLLGFTTVSCSATANQVNAKGSEATLAFPSMLNERFDAFSHFIDSGDTNPPTKAQQEVFQKFKVSLRLFKVAHMT